MIYTIKRFSEDGEKKSHALRNPLIGVGTVAGGVLAGRAGLLGAGIQKGVGRATAQVGKWTGSNGLMKDGVMTYRKGAITTGQKELATGAKTTVDKLSRSDINLARQNANLETKKMMESMGLQSTGTGITTIPKT